MKLKADCISKCGKVCQFTEARDHQDGSFKVIREIGESAGLSRDVAIAAYDVHTEHVKAFEEVQSRQSSFGEIQSDLLNEVRQSALLEMTGILGEDGGHDYQARMRWMQAPTQP